MKRRRGLTATRPSFCRLVNAHRELSRFLASSALRASEGSALPGRFRSGPPPFLRFSEPFRALRDADRAPLSGPPRRQRAPALAPPRSDRKSHTHEHETRRLRPQARHAPRSSTRTAPSSASPSSRRAPSSSSASAPRRRTATRPSSSASTSARRSTRTSPSPATSRRRTRRPEARREGAPLRAPSSRRSTRSAQTIKLDEIFQVGQKVDARGITRGRGFTGVMRRWSFAGFVQTHGTHEYRRHGGSIGTNMTPGRTLPNLKMPGQYGNETISRAQPEGRARRRREEPPPASRAASPARRTASSSSATPSRRRSARPSGDSLDRVRSGGLLAFAPTVPSAPAPSPSASSPPCRRPSASRTRTTASGRAAPSCTSATRSSTPGCGRPSSPASGPRTPGTSSSRRTRRTWDVAVAGRAPARAPLALQAVALPSHPGGQRHDGPAGVAGPARAIDRAAAGRRPVRVDLDPAVEGRAAS